MGVSKEQNEALQKVLGTSMDFTNKDNQKLLIEAGLMSDPDAVTTLTKASTSCSIQDTSASVNSTSANALQESFYGVGLTVAALDFSGIIVTNTFNIFSVDLKIAQLTRLLLENKAGFEFKTPT